jgi:S-adenosylmethionine uptake transporter
LSSFENDAAARNVERAMAIMVVAMLLLPAIDALAKVLAATVPVGLIAWSRFAFQTVSLAPAALKRHGGSQRGLWPVHAARGALLAVTTLMFFAALRVLPLADAISIFFVEPLILTLLSAVLLGETIGWRRLSAVAIGFLGALIIVRPSYEIFGLNALLPLAAAFCFALYLILTRRIATREHPTTMQFHAGFFGFLVMSAGLAMGTVFDVEVLTPVWPSLREWLLLALVGVVATVGHQMVVHAFRRAEAAILAPFQYLEIVGATAYGFFLFDDFPDPTTWLGVAIIIGSGIYVFHRERNLARADADGAR